MKIKILTLELEHYSPIVLGLEGYFGWAFLGGRWGLVRVGGGTFWVVGGGLTFFMGEWGGVE